MQSLCNILSVSFVSILSISDLRYYFRFRHYPHAFNNYLRLIFIMRIIIIILKEYCNNIIDRALIELVTEKFAKKSH